MLMAMKALCLLLLLAGSAFSARVPSSRRDGSSIRCLDYAVDRLLGLLCSSILPPNRAIYLAAYCLRSEKARSQYTDAANRDLVETLPGWGPVEGFNLFAGWVLQLAPV